jgi:NIMA (never in mitosis gene a)-related kinase 2
MSYEKMTEKEREQLSNEFKILASLRHENIVAYYQRGHLVAEKEVHLYMEYCGGGDLAKVISENRAARRYPTEEYVWDIFAQLGRALYRCHFGADDPPVGGNVLEPVASPTKLRSKTQPMIIHRDLKPDNSKYQSL